jgi:hypothetical protein
MAPKAQKRSLKTTRPRRNAARIAQERARRSPKRASSGRDDDDSTGKRLVTTGRGNKKVPGRATRVRRREERTEVKRGRFLLLVGFMSLLGFTTVYLGETALGTVQSLGQDGEALWDKIVDRLLDRDIPLVEQPAARAPSAPAPKPKGLEQRPPLPQRAAPVVRVEKLPKAPVPKTPRAELPAPSPVEYAREVGAAPASPRSDEDAAKERAARIEALLEKVGVER